MQTRLPPPVPDPSGRAGAAAAWTRPAVGAGAGRRPLRMRASHLAGG